MKFAADMRYAHEIKNKQHLSSMKMKKYSIYYILYFVI